MATTTSAGQRIELPDFKGSSCQLLTACGELIITKPRYRKRKELVASYGAAGGKAYLRVVYGSASMKHVHIDVASPKYFTKGAPKTTTRLDDLARELGKLIGEKVDVRVRGIFKLGIDDLPATGPIRSMAIKTKPGPLSVSMTGGVMSIEGAPVSKVSWSVEKNGKSVEMRVEGHLNETIGPEYLRNALTMFELFLNRFALGRK